MTVSEIIWSIIIVLFVCGGIASFSNKQKDTPSSYNSDCSLSDTKNDKDCSILEPNDPYNDGSGHFAGFEWAQENGASGCDGNSDSFNDVCEEYLRQYNAYDECLSNQK